MLDVHKLHDTKMRPYYLALGDYRPLLPLLKFKPGWRGSLEELFLSAQYYLPKKTEAVSVFQRIEDILKQSVRSGLLYNTSWYKDTQWIGFIQTDRDRYFIKMYKDPEESIFQNRQSAFIREHFAGSFTIASTVAEQGLFIIYHVIDRKRAINAEDHIEQKIVHVTEEFIKSSQLNKSLRHIIPIGFYSLCHQAKLETLAEKIRIWQNGSDKVIPLIPIHGDMTPWNMFVSSEEKLVLVDYERAGWHVPYYDVFHYILQPLMLGAGKIDLETVFVKQEWFRKEDMQDYLVLYLIDQIYHTLGDRYLKLFKHKYLDDIIPRQADLLLQALEQGGNA